MSNIIEEMKEVFKEVFRDRLDKEKWDIESIKDKDVKRFRVIGKDKVVKGVEVNNGWICVVVKEKCSVEDMDKIWDKLNMSEEDRIWKVGFVDGVEVGVMGLCCCWGGGCKDWYGGYGVDVNDVRYFGRRGGGDWVEIKDIVGSGYIYGLSEEGI